MTWVNILKRGKSIVYPVFKQAVRNIIEDMDDFIVKDIINAVSDEYMELLKEGKHMHPSAIKQHTRRRVNQPVISRVIESMGTHYARINQRDGTHKKVWRKSK